MLARKSIVPFLQFALYIIMLSYILYTTLTAPDLTQTSVQTSPIPSYIDIYVAPGSKILALSDGVALNISKYCNISTPPPRYNEYLFYHCYFPVLTTHQGSLRLSNLQTQANNSFPVFAFGDSEYMLGFNYYMVDFDGKNLTTIHRDGSITSSVIWLPSITFGIPCSQNMAQCEGNSTIDTYATSLAFRLGTTQVSLTSPPPFNANMIFVGVGTFVFLIHLMLTCMQNFSAQATTENNPLIND